MYNSSRTYLKKQETQDNNYRCTTEILSGSTLPAEQLLPQIMHDGIGFAAIICVSILVVIFLVKRDLPISLLRKARPIMFLTLFLWILVFAPGLLVFLGFP